MIGGPENSRLQFTVGRDRNPSNLQNPYNLALTIQSIYQVCGGDILPLSVFGVSDCVVDDVLKLNFQQFPKLFWKMIP